MAEDYQGSNDLWIRTPHLFGEKLRELGLCHLAKRRLKGTLSSGLELPEGELQSRAKIFLEMIVDYSEE